MPHDFKKVALTHEERLILTGRANGLKQKEIAKQLGVSVRRVEHLYARAKKKRVALERLSQQPRYSAF